MAIVETRDKTPRSDKFSEDYRVEVFVLWYSKGKPSASILVDLIKEPDPIAGKKPSEYTLRNWIKSEFAAKAMATDEMVATELAQQLVADKVAMLYQHASIAQRLVDWGLAFFDEHEIKNEKTALSMVIEGLKIERQSRGTPVALAKISGLSNEQLIDELESLVTTDGIIDAIEGNITDAPEDLPDM